MTDKTESVFDAPSNTEAREDQSTDGSYLDRLVGPGKKFATVEDLARGKWESDYTFIPQLLEEKRGLERDLNTRMTLEDFVNRTRTTTSQQDGPPPPTTPVSPPDTTRAPMTTTPTDTVSKTDLSKIVEETVREQETKRHQARNRQIAKDKLQEIWGTNYPAHLRERAQALGLGERFLDELAGTSPEAFLNALGATKSTSSNPITSPLTDRSAPVLGTGSSSTVRDKTFYDKMKKDNPDLYKRPDIVAQRHRDAIKLGEAFFKQG